MKALTRTLLMALAGAWALGTALPSLADRGRGWNHPADWDCRPHSQEHRPLHHAYGPPAVVYKPPVVIHRPSVMVYGPPVGYERRVYYGPTYYTLPYHSREPSVSLSITVPLR